MLLCPFLDVNKCSLKWVRIGKYDLSDVIGHNIFSLTIALRDRFFSINGLTGHQPKLSVFQQHKSKITGKNHESETPARQYHVAWKVSRPNFQKDRMYRSQWNKLPFWRDSSELPHTIRFTFWTILSISSYVALQSFFFVNSFFTGYSFRKPIISG